MNKLTSIFAASLLTITFSAQAGDCPSLAGKYTIGKTDADFATVNEAVKALDCGGVSGNVTFLMEDGTYNEKVVMSSIQGASAFNTITFEAKRGIKENVTISHKTSDATVVMNGTQWVTFENITIDHSQGTYGNALRVDGKAGHLEFKSVVFDGVEVNRADGSASATVDFTSTAAKSDVSFSDCEVNNGSVGINKGGQDSETADSKTVITGTLFFNQFETGLSLKNEDAAVVTNNVVSSLTNNADYKAMKFDNIINRVIVSNNIINATHGATGIELKDCNSPETAMGQITNNSVTVGGEKQAIGLHLMGKTNNMSIGYNRVKLNIAGEQTTNQAYYKNEGTGNNINLSSCIFYDLTTGGYTLIGNTYKDMFNQLPGQTMTASANGLSVEKVSPIK